MFLNAKALFDDYNVDYIKEKDGWLNVSCPFPECGDRKSKMGFNVSGGYFHCWRCGWHSAYETLPKLIKNIDINKILTQYKVSALKRKEEVKINNVTFVDVPGKRIPKKYHIDYLEGRNFDVDKLIDKYDIRFADHTCAEYDYRIVFPIYYKGRIISFQTRDVRPNSNMRYLACPKDGEIMHHKSVLYNLDNCIGKNIAVVEGIFDAIRIGDNACCTFGTAEKFEQISLLKRFEKVFVVLDSDEAGLNKSDNLELSLMDIGVDCEIVELDVDDPATMTRDEVFYLKKELKLF
ncbi:MAG: hypothetical protein GY679_01240 [Mycoplasma sp.]|nr:hypothetical protein [Mycoplasma sp.]